MAWRQIILINTSFGGIASNLGEMRRKVDSIVQNSMGQVDGFGSFKDMSADFDEAAYSMSVSGGIIFIVGGHRWGDSTAKVGR